MSMPEQLKEWLVWAERIGTANFVSKDDYREAALALSDEDVESMGEIYERAHRSNDMAILSKWLLSNRGKVPMDRDERAIRNLLHLWAHLNSQSYPHFKKRGLRLEEKCRATPDWSILPAELRFLARPAQLSERFPYPYSELSREQIPLLVTPAERQEFALAADQVRKVGYSTIRQWLNTRSGAHDVETFLISSLIAVLDALDLPYYTREGTTGDITSRPL